jgi:hypothetical protein
MMGGDGRSASPSPRSRSSPRCSYGRPSSRGYSSVNQNLSRGSPGSRTRATQRRACAETSRRNAARGVSSGPTWAQRTRVVHPTGAWPQPVWTTSTFGGSRRATAARSAAAMAGEVSMAVTWRRRSASGRASAPQPAPTSSAVSHSARTGVSTPAPSSHSSRARARARTTRPYAGSRALRSARSRAHAPSGEGLRERLRARLGPLDRAAAPLLGLSGRCESARPSADRADWRLPISSWQAPG